MKIEIKILFRTESGDLLEIKGETNVDELSPVDVDRLLGAEIAVNERTALRMHLDITK
jgi:hypothetical protein